MQKVVSVKKRVAITLALCAEYRTASHLFGAKRFTVCEIVQETCQAIMDHLLLECIQLPSPDQQQQYINSFQTKWGAQQCIGTIDRSHM